MEVSLPSYASSTPSQIFQSSVCASIQPVWKKASFPMRSSVSGSSKLFRLVHMEKAYSPMVFSPDGIFRLRRLVQLLNALLSILVTESEIPTYSSMVQPLNELPGIWVRLPWMAAILSEVQFRNTPSYI